MTLYPRNRDPKVRKLWIILGLVVFLIIVLCIILGTLASNPDSPQPEPSNTTTSSSPSLKPSPSLTPAHKVTTIKTTAPAVKKKAPTISKTTAPAIKRTTTSPTITYVQNVHPGAFCKEHGAYGYSSSGVKYQCTKTNTDQYYRWRRV